MTYGMCGRAAKYQWVVHDPRGLEGRVGVEERGEEEVAGKEMESDRVRRQVKRLPRGSSAGR